MANIKLFESNQIRSVWDETNEKWYFSVQDVVKTLTSSTDVKQYIKRILSRDEQLRSNWGTICTPVEMIAADGKKRKIQAADTKGLLRIIQSIPSPKAEPFHMTDLELTFSMLGEASTTAIVKTQNPIGFKENQQVAKQGGAVAGNARKELESKTGQKVVSKQNYLPEKKKIDKKD